MPAPPQRRRSVKSARKWSTPNARPRDILSINRVIFGRYSASTRQNSRARYLGELPFHFKNSVVFGRFIETFQKKIFFCDTARRLVRYRHFKRSACTAGKFTLHRRYAVSNHGEISGHKKRRPKRRTAFFPTKPILPKASPTNSRAGCQTTAPFLFQTDPSGNSPLYTRDFCCYRVQSRTTTP